MSQTYSGSEGDSFVSNVCFLSHKVASFSSLNGILVIPVVTHTCLHIFKSSSTHFVYSYWNCSFTTVWSLFSWFYRITAVFVWLALLKCSSLSRGVECLFLSKLLLFSLLFPVLAASYCWNVAVTGSTMGRVTNSGSWNARLLFRPTQSSLELKNFLICRNLWYIIILFISVLFSVI